MFVYGQLIDQRDLPPEELLTAPPFIATDRAGITGKNDKVYIILDNADDIDIQDFDETTEVVMVGNVRVRFDGSFLKSEKLIVTIKDNIVINVGAYGNVEFTFSGTKYLVDSLNYQPDMERGIMYNVRSIMGGMGGDDDKPWFYRADKVTIQDRNSFVIENVVMSTSDVRFDHFAIRASKLWYIQGKVTVALGIEYMTGQASFGWLPAYIRMEGAGTLRTSFGNEKRIGYYFINNVTVDSKVGQFDFGFDIYERQGEYVQMNYALPPVGIVKKLELQTKIANDVRIIKDGDLYSQWVEPTYTGSTNRITQFAWYYKLSVSLATNNISLDFYTEDLNDPFFISKYSVRSRFDNAESPDYIELINPSLNSWYGYQGDSQPQYSSITRGLSLRSGNFSLTGKWNLLQITKPEITDNEFLNKYYDYEVRSMTFPSISYNFGTLRLVDYKLVTTNSVTVFLSDGRTNTINIHKLPEYEIEVSQLSNRSIRREITLADDGSFRTNYLTNWNPVTITRVNTNSYNMVDIGASASASASYIAQRTFGTNDSSTVQDIDLLTTNWVTIADQYQHEETGNMNLSTKFFNNLWTIDNSIVANYKEVWSSFAENYTNSMRCSGFRSDYTLKTTLSTNKIWNDSEANRTSLGFSSSVNFTYPLYYLLRMQEDYVKESTLSWNNSLNWEWLQWQRQTILGATLSANWITKYRVPTEDQQKIIDNDPDDIYFGKDNIYDRVTVGAKAKLFWVNIGTEATVDLLNTTTNNSTNTFIPVTGSSFTNRFVGGYPKLLVEFTPDSKYHYIPSLKYRYNLFEESTYTTVMDSSGNEYETVLREDKSYNLEFLWNAKIQNYQIPALYPFIYELSEFGFTMQFYQDFVNMRNSYLSLSFVVGVKFTKYLTFKFSSYMVNSSIYLYYKDGIYNGESILAPDETYKSFWGDLWDGLSIWDEDALKESSFKLQSLNFELIHDLDTWDMRVIFNLGRRVDDVKQVAFWEPYVGVAFTMKGSITADIFPEFQKRFVPTEYQ